MMNIGKFMSICLLTLTSASAKAGIICHSVDEAISPTNVTIKLQSGPLLVPNIPQKILGISHINQESYVVTYKSEFVRSAMYLRIGYIVNLYSQLNEDTKIELSARSFTNEGTAEKFAGKLISEYGSAHPNETHLTCN